MHSTSRLRAAAQSLLLLPLLCNASLTQAQNYPNKVIKLIVPFPPGGPADIIARPVAEKLGIALGQPVVIENRGGASGTIGAAAVTSAPPDGYTLLLGTSNEVTMSPTLYKALPYDPNTAFAPITPVADFPNLLVVRPTLAAKNFTEFVALARSQRLSYASSGIGSTNHLTAELFRNLAKVEINHVPYKGGGQATTDLAGGHVDALFATMPSAVALVKGNKIRAIVSTGTRRSAALPEVPTTREVGMPELVVSTWNGILAPAGTPRAIVERLHAELAKVVADPDFKEKMNGVGADPTLQTPDEFLTSIKSDYTRWAGVIKRAGITVE
ncbi:MAG: hypothetical protein JWN73_3530 [Betaproteobacteria bacterium]|nr:hypothetical protein [Betaproteobacteria bacterium]